MFKKISAIVYRRQDELIGNCLDSPLFWLDNIFKGRKRQNMSANVGQLLLWRGKYNLVIRVSTFSHLAFTVAIKISLYKRQLTNEIT
jgi:hypothetical protein